MTARRLVLALALVPIGASPAAAVPCPGAGTITLVADNRSAEASVTLTVAGTRVGAPGACDVGATGLATSYVGTMTCTGAGAQPCGQVGGLAPGLWVHRVSVHVTGSATQEQAQRTMVVARGAGGVSNVVDWTVFARTFVVDAATDVALFAALDAAQAFTAGMPAPARALVRFDPAVFPGAAAPKTIDLKFQITPPDTHLCGADAVCSDGRSTTYCLEQSRVTVDALDADALPGGVVLDVGTCRRSLVRIYGEENVLRGLELRGSSFDVSKDVTKIPLDTVAIAGAKARRNRLEQCTIVGPTLGDGLSVEGGAGQPDGQPDPENAVVASEIRDAEDKGVKCDFGGVVRVERTCIHDNANGGIQSTLGGTVAAIENVVQHNVGGGAQNGLLVGVPMEIGDPNALATRGNVVRFNGARGISVVNAATADLASDVVTDNYEAGLRVETTLAGVAPVVTARGGAYACNFAPGLCSNGMGVSCRVDADCTTGPCGSGAGSAFASRGIGVALVSCTDPGCASPVVDLGATGDDGRNAVALNANPGATVLPGINVRSALAAASPIAARGNQWEHCDVPDPNPADATRCNVPQVALYDLAVVPGTATLDLGAPASPRAGSAPAVTAISPPRPRAGQLVRVYGGPFDAIDGNACVPAGLPADACSIENPDVATRNATDAHGNRVTVTIGGAALSAPVHQVSPSMLVIAMPADCFAVGTIAVARGDDVGAPAPICDPGGCDGRPDGAVCDDDDRCTTGEACRAGACTPTGTVTCDDGHACTDDACTALAGCTHAARTGLGGVRCHVVQLRALLATMVPAAQPKLGRRLGKRVGCVDARLARAAQLGDASRARRRQARRALGCTTRYLRMVERAPGLSATARGALVAEGRDTRSAIAVFFGL